MSTIRRGTGNRTIARVPVIPLPPRTVEETGLPLEFLVELVCKTMYFGGVLSLHEISGRLGLPLSVTNDVMEFVKTEYLADIKKGGGIRAAYQYLLTDLGRERAKEYLQRSGYLGAAPVPLATYSMVANKQSIRNMSVTRDVMENAFDGVILQPRLLDRLGPAVNSGRSIFLYGPSGNGKTFIAEHLAKVLSGNVFIPHALFVDNQVIRTFDPVTHRAVDTGSAPDPTDAFREESREYDRRWVLCNRPVVIAGGELTLSMLDLSFDNMSKSYEAPLQLKANGGVFLIDDLGRQLVRPFDLLNRWIVPLEKARDFLSLQNGKKFEIPFDQIILFSTNIEPRELADEAFLRRIGYKIRIDYLGEEEYTNICRQECQHLGIDFRPEGIRYLLDKEHRSRNIRLSACHPSDILSRVVEICRYEGTKPTLDEDLLRRACKDYFTEL